jgi:molybdenum cofactor cytidylyltransferase
MDIDCVVLAAGLSSRMGEFKPLLDVCGKTLVERHIESMQQFYDSIIIVGGHRATELFEVVTSLPKVKTVCNDKFALGMFTSVKAGLRAVTAQKCSIMPVDNYPLGAQTYESIVSCRGRICVPAFDGKRGHPLTIDAGFIPEILEMDDERKLSDFTKTQTVHLLETADEAVVSDIDTIERYNRFLQYYNRTVS